LSCRPKATGLRAAAEEVFEEGAGPKPEGEEEQVEA
jgi:hypothetical protein